jgi:hypothetical protein
VRSGALRLDGEESAELRWVTLADADALALSPAARIVVPTAFAHRGRTFLPAVRWAPPASV